jgi:hypothetical protein
VIELDGESTLNGTFTVKYSGHTVDV